MQDMTKYIFRISSILLLLTISVSISAQTTTTWVGSLSDTDWHNASNWTAGIPDGSTVAIINNGGLVIISQDAIVASVRLEGSGGILNIDASLTIDPQGATPSPITGIEMIELSSFINIGDAGLLAISNANNVGINVLGQIINDGQITIDNCNIGLNNGTSGNARLENRGKISISNSTANAIAYSAGIFINDFCGHIHTGNDNIFSSVLENIGVISTSADENTNFQIGSITSLGIIHAPNGASFFDASFTALTIEETNPAANYWRGCSSASWSDACNWSQIRVPIKADSVVISSGGTGNDPELSSNTDSVMHVSIDGSLTIKDQGRLIVDGSTASTSLIGIDNRANLTVESGGRIHVMNTTSIGIISRSSFTNAGTILVEDAISRSVTLSGPTSSFVNTGTLSIEIDNPNTSGINNISGSNTTNSGQINIQGAQFGILSTDDATTFTNNGSIDINNSSLGSIVLSNQAGGTPTMTNAACSVISTDGPFSIDAGTSLTNSGLINYDAGAPNIQGTYTDDSYQYDPNDGLPDGMNTIVLSEPLPFVEFVLDLDGDGTSFCEGDTDDIIQKLNCGDMLVDQTNEVGANNLNGYPCRSFDFSAPERVYTFDVVSPDTLVTISLNNENTNTDLFILTDPADPSSCLSHSFDQIAIVLSPGRYYAVVDGFNGSTGNFDISLSCNPVQPPIPLSCGETLSNQTNLDNAVLNDYPCRAANFSGPERVYTFDVVSPDTLVTISLNNENTNTDLFILTDPADPSSCLSHSFDQIAIVLSPGRYYAVVDGFNGSTGNFDISLSCNPVQPPIPLSCGDILTDQNNLDNSVLDDYSCRFADFSAPERVYTFDVVAPDTLITISLDNETAGTELFILTDPADPNSCLVRHRAQVITRLTPGTYFAVVDGFNGAIADFDISMSCSVPGPLPLCSNAISLICGQTIDGSVGELVVDPENNEGCNLDEPGPWFRFIGTGGEVTASLCNTQISFNSEIAVLTGSCGDLTCVADNDDTCGLLSEASFSTVAGQNYWIHVQERRGDSGDFTLTLTCADDEVCLSERILSGPLLAGTYTASDRIIVDGSVSAPNEVILSAPTVEFRPLSEVSDGLLEVDQEGCE